MKGSKVASRYAQSLLDLAVERNVLDKINGDMKSLASVCRESKDLQNLLKSPIVNSDMKIKAFNEIFGKSMDEMSLGFVKLIVKNKRGAILSQIAESFTSLYKEHNNILEVTVVSAKALENTVKDKILARVQENHSGTIELTEEVDEALIGGFVVKMGDKQIDSSIARQLTNLNNILLN
ncbi:MAG: ATP synthase F1 subunit delta [Flavobacteriales bacterium]|nr:ATP synthase F1 subunit delta [Flavobacteriales bacterium]